MNFKEVILVRVGSFPGASNIRIYAHYRVGPSTQLNIYDYVNVFKHVIVVQVLHFALVLVNQYGFDCTSTVQLSQSNLPVGMLLSGHSVMAACTNRSICPARFKPIHKEVIHA